MLGETERSLKARFGEHRRPSSTTSDVSKHLHTDSPDHTITLESTKILSVEHKWFKIGVKEVIGITNGGGGGGQSEEFCYCSRSSLTPYRDDITLRKAAETDESFVSVKAFVSCDNG